MRDERSRILARRETPIGSASAWRGRSGRRYIVGICDLTEPEMAKTGASVMIAVRRDEAGIAVPVSVASSDESPRMRLRAWLANARRRGATEMHVHRFAATDSDRNTIVADLAIEPTMSVANEFSTGVSSH